MGGAYGDFIEGLQTLGALQLIKSHPTEMTPPFVASAATISAEAFAAVFIPRYSPTGANRRER